METNDNIIIIDETNSTLRLSSEPGRYIGFITIVKGVILKELNTGKILHVIMPNNIEADILLSDLLNLNINIDNIFNMKIEDNILEVSKKITYKNGL